MPIHKIAKYTKEILEEYANGSSALTIAKKYKATASGVKYLLKRNGITLDCGSRPKVNQNFFSNLDDPETQYWLGWLITDGSLGSTDNRIELSITSKDQDVIEKYALFLGLSNLDIQRYKSKNKNWDTKLTVRFGHKETHQFLISLGITPKKSYVVCPKFRLTPHVIRGIIEGDGYISDEGKPQIILTSASECLKDLYIDFLQNHSIKYSVQKNKSVYRIIVSTRQTLKLIDIIYSDTRLKSLRKFQKVINIKNKYNESISRPAEHDRVFQLGS